MQASRGICSSDRRFVRGLGLTGSPSYVNQALRTVRRLLGKAVEWNVIATAPRIRLLKELGREQTIDPESEAKLLAVGKQPLKDVLIITQGSAPGGNFSYSRREHRLESTGDFQSSRQDPGITATCSHQSADVRAVDHSLQGEENGLAFSPSRAESGHRTTVAKHFRDARRKAGLPEPLVLYCARHTFGTAVYEATGNLAMVIKVMGHTDARTAMQYQHPVLDPIREAIDQRNVAADLRHNLRHSEYLVQ